MILHGDCLDVLPTLEANSIEACVTDPPYGLAFMGKDWDHGVPGERFWREVLRVLKPGGHLLAFGGTRTYHRLACAIEDAGFEVRDCLMWIYGSGFPKSLDVSKAFDKAAGAKREVIGTVRKTPSASSQNMHDGWRRPWADGHPSTMDITAPSTDLARQWSGWGTALKPAYEPILLARKPLAGTVAATVARYGTGAINIDGCRVGTESTQRPTGNHSFGKDAGWNQHSLANVTGGSSAGRWPANVLHDGSDEVVGAFPTTQKSPHTTTRKETGTDFGRLNDDGWVPSGTDIVGHADSGSAARFFYCAKASRAERERGLNAFDETRRTDGRETDLENPRLRTSPRKNHHPTVKPLALMRYLVRLVTPPGGTVLDPFAGSGSTLVAAVEEGFNGLGIEQDAEYVKLATARLRASAPLFSHLTTP